MNLRGISIAAAACGALSSLAAAHPLKISQVYGGASTSSATFRQDYIELFNSGAIPLNLAGTSIQYASSTGTTWTARELSGTIPPGSYFLIRMDETTGGQGDVPVPFDYIVAPDVAMTSTSFKVALVATLEPLTGCPLDNPLVLDVVGFGTANCFEGAAAVPTLSTTTAGFRASDGCTDTDENSLDFTVGAPNPRFSGSAFNLCPVPPGSDLTLVVTGPTGSLQIGQTGSYQMIVGNFGPDAGTGIALTVPIPSNATFVSSNPAGTLAGGVLTMQLTDLAPGTGAFAQVDLQADAGPSVELVATVSSASPDGVLDNNTAAASAPVFDPANAKVVIGVDDAAQGVYAVDILSGATELLWTGALRALASDDAGRRFFYSNGSQLWTVPYDEPRTPALIGNFSGAASSMSAGLAYDSTRNRLIGTNTSGEIFDIDPATAAVVLIRDLGIGDLQGIDYDPIRDRIVCTNDSTSNTAPMSGRGLYIIDPYGAEVTKVADYPFKTATSMDSDIDGCAYGEGVIYPVADERNWFYRYSESANAYLDPFETPYGGDEVFSGATFTSQLFNPAPGANLGVQISGPAPCDVSVGGNLTYTVTVRNFGPDAAVDGTLVNTLPAGTTFVGSTPPLVPVGGQLILNTGPLPEGAVVDLMVSVTPDVAGEVTTTASVATSSSDPYPTNNDAAFTTEVQGQPPATAAAKGIFSSLPGTNAVPGDPTILIDDATAFNRIFRSYSGQHWTMTIDTDADTGVDRLLIRGSGDSFSVLAREGITPVDVGVVVGNFDNTIGINDDGEVAFGTNLSTGEEAILRTDDDGFLIVAREGFPLPADPNILYGDLSNGAQIQNDNSVSFHTDLIGPPTANDTVWLNDNGATIIVQENITVPGNQFDGASQAIESMSTGSVTGQGLYFSADGQRWCGRAILTGPTATDTALIVDGNVAIQEGFPLPGAGFAENVSLINMNYMEPHGDWMAYGSNFNGSSTNGVDWVVRNGQLLAARDQEIFPGAGIFWSENTYSQTFFTASANRFGDYIVGGLTTIPDLNANAVVVFNGAKVLISENDPIDLDNNGAFDDNAYVHVFRDDFGWIGEDGYFYVSVDVRDGSSVCTGTPAVIGEALIRIRAFCPADWNRDDAVNSNDISAFLSAWLDAVNNGGVRADYNGDASVNSNDISAFLSAWLAAISGGC